jgi:hypothetical protein
LKEEIIREVMGLDVQDKFRYFIRLEEAMKDRWEEWYQEVRYGINIKFDLLTTFIDGNVEYDMKNKRILIGGKNGLSMEPSEFTMEMIKREARMDEAIEEWGEEENIMGNKEK